MTAEEATTDPTRVLYVDDDAALTELVAQFLERFGEGLVVDTATLAEEGLRRLLDPTADYDCVVSDFRMPGMNGEEFLHAVRADQPEMPFVLFTGEGNDALEDGSPPTPPRTSARGPGPTSTGFSGDESDASSAGPTTETTGESRRTRSE
jgi:CheY-like chemotaxis protein